MTNTYDPGTVTGKVRMLCGDKGPDWIFSDEEISAYLSLSENEPRLAAALALEDIANNQALITKVKKVGSIELTSGVDIAKVLMARAETLRASVEDSSSFGVVDW
jgi:hypothetical protein